MQIKFIIPKQTCFDYWLARDAWLVDKLGDIWHCAWPVLFGWWTENPGTWALSPHSKKCSEIVAETQTQFKYSGEEDLDQSYHSLKCCIMVSNCVSWFIPATIVSTKQWLCNN